MMDESMSKALEKLVADARAARERIDAEMAHIVWPVPKKKPSAGAEGKDS